MRGKWVSLFQEGAADQRELLGGKGANLAEMTRIGLPVPPGFTVTTDACRAYLTSGGDVPPGLWPEVRKALHDIELKIGRRFGDTDKPLLLSVRSGAKFSMPGMMDTILNLGINDEIAAGVTKLANEHFAMDAYRRFIQMFGKVVLGIDADLFEHAIAEVKRHAGVTLDYELTADDLAGLVKTFKRIVTENGQCFPEDPYQQLEMAVMAVFRSWNTPRARAYRRSNHISEHLGTAVNIQAMVFGNVGNDCASGVAFTRDPNTGDPQLFGEYLPNAQGEDVVAGIRTPQPVREMATDPLFVAAYEQLLEIAKTLEGHYTDMQDVEFTVEQGKLWMLQTRTGKRTAPAAVKIAVDLAVEGLIDRKTAVRRVQPAQLEQLLHPRIDESQKIKAIATGLPASPGAATGIVVLDAMEAKRRGEAGEAVILVRQETSADDFPGMERAQGILTARGGMTSHAAVVARGMGKPAVTGCADIVPSERAGCLLIGGAMVCAGQQITIDGSTGRVMLGAVPMVEPTLGGGIDTILMWADDFRTLGVRANADLPADARRARALGAQGIGLCRTEHMFFAADRIDFMRQMILADSDEAREAALAHLEPFQTADFEAIFHEMDGLPVKIRLLDPPLHEFLPHTSEEIDRLATELGLSHAAIVERIATHAEVNPMLGLRGCRLGITYPAISRMQARAIFTAAVRCAKAGIHVEPEVMIPLVSDPQELQNQRRLVVSTAEEVFVELGARVVYHIGTMIEIPRAAILAGQIAKHADFFSFGTNDLTQMTFGLSRDDAGRFLPDYVDKGLLKEDPFQTLDTEGVGELMRWATTRGRAAKPNLTVAICGEHGGDPASIGFAHELGLDYVSCSPFRLPIARLAAAHAALGELARDV